MTVSSCIFLWLCLLSFLPKPIERDVLRFIFFVVFDFELHAQKEFSFIDGQLEAESLVFIVILALIYLMCQMEQFGRESLLFLLHERKHYKVSLQERLVALVKVQVED